MTLRSRPAAPRRLRSTLVGMFNVGGGELLVIMLIALIVLGPQRLPDAAKQVGRVMGDLRRISSGFQQELKDAFDTDDAPTPLRRKESVPLESTVAKADRDARRTSQRDTPAVTGAASAAAGVTASDADDAAHDDVAQAGDDGASTVAPAVAAALDEIVTPLEAPSAPAAAADPAGPPVADASDSAPSPADGGGALGDERAAS
jgi:sec-independent protein translocase protein TatB